jgi:SAM-dependent methyltransferase
MSEESNDAAAYFETRLGFDPARAAVWRHLATYLQRWVPAEGAVLDVACGYGDFIASIRGKRRVGIDLAPELRSWLPDEVEAHIGDATSLEAFGDGEFDTVFASNFLEHLDYEGVARCVDAMFRVLKPGGRVILVQPNFRLRPKVYFDDYTHRTIFTDRSLPDLLAAHGFGVERVEARFVPLTVKSRLSNGAALVPLYLKLPYRPLAGQMLVIAQRP